MTKWSSTDQDSGLTFSIEVAESGKLVLNTIYNKIKINPGWYEFGPSGLDAILMLINTVKADLGMKVIEKTLKIKKKKKK